MTIKKNLYVGIGGALGALLRCAIHGIELPFGAEYQPLLTMLINISGSFLLGFLMILFLKKLPVSAELRLGITTGVLGGYTTFSTMCKESVMLCFSGKFLFSAIYLATSVILGIAAAWCGILIAKRLERRHVK